MIHLDTHVLVWLFAGRRDLLSAAATQQIETNDLFVSPMVVFELELLFEIGRTAESGRVVVRELEERLDLRVLTDPFPAVVRAAAKQTWTREPFDRVIVGQAALRNAPLLTKDRTILEHYDAAVW